MFFTKILHTKIKDITQINKSIIAYIKPQTQILKCIKPQTQIIPYIKPNTKLVKINNNNEMEIEKEKIQKIKMASMVVMCTTSSVISYSSIYYYYLINDISFLLFCW